jgi:hypothetical protein
VLTLTDVKTRHHGMIFMFQIVAVEVSPPKLLKSKRTNASSPFFRGHPYLLSESLQIGPAGKVAWAHVPAIRVMNRILPLTLARIVKWWHELSSILSPYMDEEN